VSMRYVSLKALQRPLRSAKQENGSYLPLLDHAGESLSPMRKVQPDVERLARILGATTRTNDYGEYLSVRCSRSLQNLTKRR